MRNPINTGLCQSKRGLLFLRDCGAPAIATCHQCGRPVCAQHQIMDGLATICPECRGQTDNRDDHDQDDDVGNETRDTYYRRYHYEPLSYGSAHYYSDRDYRTVEQDHTRSGRKTSGTGDVDETGGVTAGPHDLGHFMES